MNNGTPSGMTNKFLHSLAILALALSAAQAQQSMAQSDPAHKGVALSPLARRQRLQARLHLGADEPNQSPNAPPRAEGVESPKKAKVYNLRTVDYPAATRSEVFDYNDGSAVGYFQFDSSPSTAFYFKANVNHLLEIPGAVSSTIYGINASGKMVGTYTEPTGNDHGFLYSGGAVTTLDFPGSSGTYAWSINASGVIVGQYKDSSSTTHGFMYKNSTYTSIDVPGASTGFDAGTFPGAINSGEVIVGYYTVNTAPFLHGFTLSNGVFTSFDYPGADGTVAYGINDSGSISGIFLNNTFTAQGYVEIGGVFTLVDVPGGTVDTNLYRIENNGYIVGSYIDSVGEYHGILGH